MDGRLQIFAGTSIPSATEIMSGAGGSTWPRRGRPLAQWRDPGQTRRRIARLRRLRDTVHECPGRSSPHGAASDHRFAATGLGGSDHSGDPVLCVRQAREENVRPRADLSQAGRQPPRHRWRRPHFDHGFAFAGHRGVLRYSGRSPAPHRSWRAISIARVCATSPSSVRTRAASLAPKSFAGDRRVAGDHLEAAQDRTYPRRWRWSATSAASQPSSSTT